MSAMQMPDELLDFRRFVHRVSHRTRYRLDEHDERLLKRIAKIGKTRSFVLSKGVVLYRAQMSHTEKLEEVELPDYVGLFRYSPGEPLSREERQNFVNVLVAPARPKRMYPRPRSAKEGRVNPKGIPCLYMADNPDTAMSEVRPWTGAYVSLGYFRTNRDLKVIECLYPSHKDSWYVSGFEAMFDAILWSQVCNAFSEPVTNSDITAHYAPTQIIAEAFKSIGCDGIKYASRLADGNSYALFNVEDAKMFKCGVHKTERVQYEFGDEMQSYLIDTNAKKPERDASPSQNSR